MSPNMVNSGQYVKAKSMPAKKRQLRAEEDLADQVELEEIDIEIQGSLSDHQKNEIELNNKINAPPDGKDNDQKEVVCDEKKKEATLQGELSKQKDIKASKKKNDKKPGCCCTIF